MPGSFYIKTENVIKRKYIEITIVLLVSYFIFLKFGGGAFHLLPATMVIGVAVVLSLVLLYFRNSNIEGYPQRLVILFILLGFLLLISLLWTKAPSYGTQKSLKFGLFLLSYVLVGHHLKNYFNEFIVFNIFFSCLYIISLFIEYGSFGDILINVNDRFRLGGSKEDLDNFNPIGISRYLGFSLICLYYLNKIFSTNKIVIIYSSIYVSIAGVFLFFSATRAPIFSLLIVFSIITVFFSKLRFKKILPILLIGVIVYFSAESVFKDKKAASLVEERYQNITDEGRLGIQAMAIKAINENIFLGAGVGNYGYLYTGKDIKVFPHNIFIEVLYENGLLGLIILLMIIYYGFKKISNVKSDYECQFLFISFLYFLINAQFSGDIETNSLLFLFIYMSNIHITNKLFNRELT